MLRAIGHVTLGARRPATVETRTHDGSVSNASAVFDMPKTCIDGACAWIEGWPHSSLMRPVGWGALRKRMPCLKASSTLRGCDHDQCRLPGVTERLAATNFDLFQDCDNEHIQS